MTPEQFHIITALLKKRFQQELTPEEAALLQQWMDESIENSAVTAELDDPEKVSSDLSAIYRANAAIAAKIASEIPGFSNGSKASANKTPGRIFLFAGKWKWAAAAVILLMLGLFIWKQDSSPEKETPPLVQQPDRSPGGAKAILLLADGRELVLDSMGNGLLAQQGNSSVTKTADGVLLYKADGKNAKAPGAAIDYNILRTPRGGQYQLTLPDGTKVWLNAASSIRYPATFPGSDRTVEIQGEAFFDIKKEKDHPFRVKINETTLVEVLGTSFNINAYSNEPSLSTTLIDGTVKVVEGNRDHQLKPGQQMAIYGPGESRILNISDPAQVIAWKNGYFDFNKQGLKAMMRQLERWYDINVIYEGAISDMIFKGQMDRQMSLSGIIQFLSASGIKASLQGRTLTISGQPY